MELLSVITPGLKEYYDEKYIKAKKLEEKARRAGLQSQRILRAQRAKHKSQKFTDMMTTAILPTVMQESTLKIQKNMRKGFTDE